MKNQWIYWFAAIVGCLTLLVSNGLSITGLPVFDSALLDEFGWARGEFKARDAITLITAGLLAPFAGILIDRFGVRRCMLAGWILLSFSFFLYSRLDSLGSLYFIHFLLGIVLTLVGLNVAVILVSNWFVRHRGIAIGIALVGTSLGGALMPQYGTAALGWYEGDWRAAMLSQLSFPLLMLLLVFFFVRSRPEDVGRRGLGAEETGALPPAADAPVGGMDYIAALKTRTFWAIAVIAMVTFYSVIGFQAHLFLYVSRDLELTPQVATNAISVFFLSALVGKLVFGALADHVNLRITSFSNVGVMLLGSIMITLMEPGLLWIALVAFGLGWGGLYTIIQLTAINSFGLKAAGKILGTITVLDAIGGGLGPWITGLIHDKYGSYQGAFLIFTVLILIAGLLLTQIKLISREADHGAGASGVA